MLRTLFKKGWKAGGSILRRVKALDTSWGGIQLFEPAPDLSFARAQDEWELRHEIYLLAGIEAYADAPPSKADQPKTRCTAGPITPIPSVGWPPRHRSQRVQKCASSCMIRASIKLIAYSTFLEWLGFLRERSSEPSPARTVGGPSRISVYAEEAENLPNVSGLL